MRPVNLSLAVAVDATIMATTTTAIADTTAVIK